MQIVGTITALRREESFNAEYVIVTVESALAVKLELRLPRHRAKGWRVGRYVEVDVRLTGRFDEGWE